MVRAMATRCFSPPLSFSPLSPTWVLYPAGTRAGRNCGGPLRDRDRAQRDGGERQSTASSAHPVSCKGVEAGKGLRGLTVGEGKDAVVDVGSPGCLLHLLVGGQDAPVADVVGDGVVEEHRVLGHHPDVSAQRRLLHLGRLRGGGG